MVRPSPCFLRRHSLTLSLLHLKMHSDASLGPSMEEARLDPLLAPSKDALSDTPPGPSKEEVRRDHPLGPSEEEPPFVLSKDNVWSDPLLAPSDEACSVEDSVLCFSVASSTPRFSWPWG